MTIRKISKYGWRRDHPDHRDFRLSPPDPNLVLPILVDLSLLPEEPPIYDQGDLGSCTAHALAAAFEAETRHQGLPDFMPSRLFIYLNERLLEGDVAQDNGAELRDGVKSLIQQGVCPEALWPYDPGQFAVEPPASVYAAALTHKVNVGYRIEQDLQHLKACLASGSRFVFGFSVFDQFESADVARTGLVSLPGPKDAPLGGHAVCAVGYNDALQTFKVRNSWGAGWGDEGYFHLPYAYLTNPDLASDFWTQRTVS